MSIYNNILVAIDLNEETHKVALKAHQIGQQTGAKMTLIHVTEPLSYAYGGDVPMDLSAIQQQLHDHAQQRMDDFIQLHQLSDVDQLLTSGHIETEVHRMANELSTDLIVVGSHGRHGLALLLGSTSNGILHGATCDVLAVRI
ncbi:MAG: universal stress protein [Oceanospirillaceae bacterium]|jgi:universal stress protein A|nr:universal stress protein [Oceanospirillaceae bacterium]MBT4442574.1 universal stress protein [Oceanospirillaceae bacterium]MBT6076896.1 universal stress protein [Oceanospirillaceae bacterium]MBT7331347.1 universal stress protein [Oceanospirillaceae bacterium]